MITTPDLIDLLAKNAEPVRRLQPPLWRAMFWLLVALVVVLLLAVGQGLREDLLGRLQDPNFAVGIGAMLITGILAIVSTFMVCLPDRSRFWPLLPVPTAIVWLSTVGYQWLTNWISLEPDGMTMGETARCLAMLVLTSLPLSLVPGIMLWRSAPIRPLATALTGSLAVAAITATALSLLHELDATIMILIWNAGTAVLFAGAGALAGPRILS